MNAQILMLIGGVSAFLITIYWVRGRDLRERYAIGWLAIATLLLIFGIFPNAILEVAQWCRLAPSAAVLFVALTVIYIFCFFVTVSLTRQHRRSTRLLQELALAERRIRELERQVGQLSRPISEDDHS